MLIVILTYYSGSYGDAGLLQASDFLLFYLQHSWQVNMLLYAGSYVAFLYVFISLFFKNMNILIAVLQGERELDKVPFYFKALPEFQVAKDKVEDMISKRNDSKLRSDEEREHKNELLMYLAHDLKTPLTSMIGYINHILDHHVDDTAMDQSLTIANDKAQRLDELIDEFEEILRYDDKVSMLDITELDVAELIDHQLKGFYPLMENRGIRPEVRLPEQMMIEADYDKLQRLFDNLMRNAITYGNENADVLISGSIEEHHVYLEYRNEGEDLDEETINHLFDKFYRASTARTSSSGGAGLGLAIAKEIVVLHHGEITVHKEGNQIVFQIVLPIHQGAAI